MTRDEFTSLPLKIALGVIYDVATRLKAFPKPDVPRPPLYDGRHSKGKEGFVWMSEMAPGDLEWWANKKEENAAQGGQYAEQNAKSAKSLRAWLVWRDCFPYELWTGKRGDERVTAKPPSRNPDIHQWPAKDGKGHQPNNTRSAPQEPPEEDLNF